MSLEKIYIDPENIDLNLVGKVAESIREGKIVAMPTDTVYGLAANLSRKDVLERLYKIKQRPIDKPFTVHISSAKDIDFFTDILPPYGYRMIEKFWPGPLTIVYYKKDSFKTIGLRCPIHPVTSLILKESSCFVVMPSANVSGNPPAVTAQEVEDNLGEEIDLLVDSLSPQLKVSSTVVDLTVKPVKIKREGSISSQEIKKVTDVRRILFVCTGNTCRSVMAEYLLKLYLKDKNFKLYGRIEPVSCGTHAYEGARPSYNVVNLLRKEGIDCSQHRARLIDRHLIRSSDIIVVMDAPHKYRVGSIESSSLSRVFLLGSFLKDYNRGIPDPVGGTSSVFEEVFSWVKEGIKELVEWL